MEFLTLGCSQVVRQLVLVQSSVGSNPTTPATSMTTFLSIFKSKNRKEIKNFAGAF